MPGKLFLQLLIIFALVTAMFLVALGILPAPQAPGPIHLYGGPRTEIDVSTQALAAIQSSTDTDIHLVVQFDRILTPTEQRLIESVHGIRILEAVPENAYVVSFPTAEAVDILNDLENAVPPRRGVVHIRPRDKLSPALGKPGSITAPIHAQLTGSLIGVVLNFFDDTTNIDQLPLFDAMRGQPIPPINRYLGKDNQYRIGISAPVIDQLLAEDSVRWIAPIPAPPVEDLAPTAAHPGAREIAGFSGNAGGGKGVVIAQWEICTPRKDHPGLQGRTEQVVTGVVSSNYNWSPSDCTAVNPDYTDGRTFDAHPTMVAGIMAGAPVQHQSVLYDGVPQVEFYGMASGASIRTYRVDPTHQLLPFDYADAIAQGSTISQNSWGEGCYLYSISSAPYYREGSALYDKVVSGRDYLGNSSSYDDRMLIVTSAGNDGDENNIPSLWGSARITNSAKNVLMVGNVNTQTLDTEQGWAHLSSGRGPTKDGRIAPVLSAPGVKMEAASSHGIRSTWPANTYKKMWGTSFSAPLVSGAAALLTQTYRETCAAEPVPMELRAILVHTAHDLQRADTTLTNPQFPGDQDFCGLPLSQTGSPALLSVPSPQFSVQQGPVYKGPDYIFGYGLVQTDSAKNLARQSHFVTGEISRGYVEYDVEVQLADLEDNQLRVTLAWDDPPWPINVPPGSRHGLLQNDLDLELIDPSGRRHLPWVLDPDNPAQPAKRHSSGTHLPVTMEMRDQRNTIEQVAVETPEFGTWTIRVRAGLMIRPAQSFTLVSRAIAPQTACGNLPLRVVEDPFELPDSWLWWWLMWLAIAVLVLMILVLLWLIWKTYKGQQGWQSPWLHMLVALALVALVFYLVFLQLWLVLAVLMILLLIVFVWLS